MKKVQITVAGAGVVSNSIAVLIQNALTEKGITSSVSLTEPASTNDKHTRRIADAKKAGLEVSVTAANAAPAKAAPAKAEAAPAKAAPAKAEAAPVMTDKRWMIVRKSDTKRLKPATSGSAAHVAMTDIDGPVNNRDARRGLWAAAEDCKKYHRNMARSSDYAVYVADMDASGKVFVSKAVICN